MKSIISICELRKICQTTKEGHAGVYYFDWSERVPRILSIYITRLLIQTPLTPNQITTLNIIFAIGSIGLLWPMQWWGYMLYVLSLFVVAVVDCCDGEVARYKNMRSYSGLYLDISEATLSRSIMFVALGVFYYWHYESLWGLVLGFSASNAYLLAKTLHYTKFRVLPPKSASETMTAMPPKKRSPANVVKYLIEVVAQKPPATYFLFLSNGLYLAVFGRDCIVLILALFTILYLGAACNILFQVGVKRSLDNGSSS